MRRPQGRREGRVEERGRRRRRVEMEVRRRKGVRRWGVKGGRGEVRGRDIRGCVCVCVSERRLFMSGVLVPEWSPCMSGWERPLAMLLLQGVLGIVVRVTSSVTLILLFGVLCSPFGLLLLLIVTVV